MTPRTAYRLDYLTRQQFIDAQFRIAEARRRFKERFPGTFPGESPKVTEPLSQGEFETTKSILPQDHTPKGNSAA